MLSRISLGNPMDIFSASIVTLWSTGTSLYLLTSEVQEGSTANTNSKYWRGKKVIGGGGGGVGGWPFVSQKELHNAMCQYCRKTTEQKAKACHISTLPLITIISPAPPPFALRTLWSSHFWGKTDCTFWYLCLTLPWQKALNPPF